MKMSIIPIILVSFLIGRTLTEDCGTTAKFLESSCTYGSSTCPAESYWTGSTCLESHCNSVYDKNMIITKKRWI